MDIPEPNVDELEAKKDFEGLVRALEHGSDSQVRRKAAKALGKIGDSKAVEPLIQLLKDEDYFVRVYAAGALDELGWKPGDNVEGAYYFVAKRQWYQLARLGKEAIEALNFALEDIGRSDTQLRAVEVLRQIGNATAVEPLIRALKPFSSTIVRINAAQALGEIGDIRAIEPLIKNLHEGEYSDIRYSACEALVKIGEPAVKPLIQTLKKGDRAFSEMIQKTLGGMRDTRAVEPFIEALEDEDYRVRKCAAEALGGIGDERAVEPLVQALQDEYGSVRYLAVCALEKIGDERALESLSQVALKEDEEYLTRRSAEWALQTIKAKRQE